jgi:hypothetical protein
MYSRARFSLTVTATVTAACAFVGTLIEPQWFELLFDARPDAGDGSLETWLALGCSLLSFVLFGGLALFDLWRRPLPSH